MRLEKLTLKNIGPFYGSTEFDLSVPEQTKRTKNVILVGGKNGCGKTNILESLRLCLHGKRGVGTRLTDAQYQAELRKRIHRHPDVADAMVQLEFTLSKGDGVSKFAVRRSWKPEQESVVEELAVLENGSVLSAVPIPFWQNFLDEIVPPNLAQLFFFDGERIQELASDDRSEASQALSEAVENLFGLSLVNRLVADLAHVERQVSGEGGAEQAKQIAALHEEQAELEKQLRALQERHHKTSDQIAREKSRQDRLEDKLQAGGSSYAKRREELSKKKASSATRLEVLEKEFRQKCDEFFPFLMCRDLLDRLKGEVESNQEVQAFSQAREVIAKKAKTIRQAFTPQALTRLDRSLVDTQKSKLKSYLEGIVAQLLEEESNKNAERAIELSGRDYRRLLNWIDDVEVGAAKDARRLNLDMEIAARELSDASKEFENAPSEEDLVPLFEELRLVSEKVGTLSAESDTLDDELREVQLRLDEVERKLKKLAENVLDSDELSMVFKRSVAAREAAKKFGVQLTQRKLDELSVQVLRLFNQLARKQEVVSHIKIDPKSYQLEVFTRHGGAMPKDRFSAGERQILAVSILWALAQMSGRALPMVIDTPLGRLDSEHRQKLVTNYFTQASHQVIILSTDEEVDEKFYRQLGPNLAHAYHLEFNSKSLRTTVSTGYFWDA